MQLNEATGITRNPWGIDAGPVREARLAVCDELERLQKILASHTDCDVLQWNNTGLELTVTNLQAEVARLEAENESLMAGARDLAADRDKLYDEAKGRREEAIRFTRQVEELTAENETLRGENIDQSISNNQLARAAKKYREILQSVHDDLFDYGTGKLTAETMRLVEDEMGAK